MSKGYSSPKGRRVPAAGVPWRHGKPDPLGEMDGCSLQALALSAAPPAPCTARAAALAVCARAAGAGDARELLAMLGLLEAAARA